MFLNSYAPGPAWYGAKWFERYPAEFSSIWGLAALIRPHCSSSNWWNFQSIFRNLVRFALQSFHNCTSVLQLSSSMFCIFPVFVCLFFWSLLLTGSWIVMTAWFRYRLWEDMGSLSRAQSCIISFHKFFARRRRVVSFGLVYGVGLIAPGCFDVW